MPNLSDRVDALTSDHDEAIRETIGILGRKYWLDGRSVVFDIFVVPSGDVVPTN